MGQDKKTAMLYGVRGKKAIGTNLLGYPINPEYIGATTLEESKRFKRLNRHNILIDNLVSMHGYNLDTDFEMYVIAKDLTLEEAEELETKYINSVPAEASLNVVKVSYFAKQARAKATNAVLSISSYSGKNREKLVAMIRENGEKFPLVCSYGASDLIAYCTAHNIPLPAGRLAKLQKRASRLNWRFQTRGITLDAKGEKIETTEVAEVVTK